MVSASVLKSIADVVVDAALISAAVLLVLVIVGNFKRLQSLILYFQAAGARYRADNPAIYSKARRRTRR